MKLQQIVMKKTTSVNENLYYRILDEKKQSIPGNWSHDGSLVLSKGESVSFDTFFHSFSIKKWKMYTKFTSYRVTMTGLGKFVCQLCGAKTNSGGLERSIFLEKEIDFENGGTCDIDIPETDCEICYLVFTSMASASKLKEISYNGFGNEEPQEVYLALDICTFKREPYLKRNIQVIKDNILNNEDSLLYNNVEIFISDNANTLGDMFAQYDHVHVNPNENVGGVGGFTRGMIEAMEYPTEKPFTHILIMDDDAIIEPLALERTYVLLANLKDEYKSATVGGALLRENTPHIQFESGAAWDRGHIKAHHHHYDLCDFEMVVANEKIEHTEYTGWWYTAIPVERIKKVGLPLPLFIHRDDIEYGIRAGAEKFILMNGIAVWHEAFENKMPGATEYYDLRNMAIINCIHYGDYNVKEIKYFLKRWVISNIVRYRYEYVDMNIRGIHDFCKGIDWLKEQDGAQLHQNILKMNYKAKPAKEYVGYKDITEADLLWDNLEQVEERTIGLVEKLFKRITFNGAIFPAKGVKVVRPHSNLYDIYRMKEVLYVDSAGNALLLKRDNKKAKECFHKLNQALKELDEKFEEAKETYASRYEDLICMEFWKQYLKM